MTMRKPSRKERWSSTSSSLIVFVGAFGIERFRESKIHAKGYPLDSFLSLSRSYRKIRVRSVKFLALFVKFMTILWDGPQVFDTDSENYARIIRKERSLF